MSNVVSSHKIHSIKVHIYMYKIMSIKLKVCVVRTCRESISFAKQKDYNRCTECIRIAQDELTRVKF